MTTYTDDFERPDAATLGTAWNALSSWNIASGAAVPNGTATRVAQRTQLTATHNQRARWQAGNTVGGAFVGVCAMMPTLGATLDTTGAFYVAAFSGSTMTSLGIRRHEANATGLSSPLASGTTTALAPDSTVEIETRDVTGGVEVKALHNGAVVVTFTDTSGAVPTSQRCGGMYASGTAADTMRFGAFAVEDVVVVAADTTPPTVPTGLTATAVSASQVNVSWAASTDAVGVTGYRLRRGGVLVASPAATSHSDTNVAASTAYSYTVSAVDAAGNESAQTAAVLVTTPAAIGVLLKHDLAGVAAGTPITVANSATTGNNAFNTVNTPVGSTVAYDATSLAVSKPSALLTTDASGAVPFLGWTLPNGGSKTPFFQMALRRATYPESAQDFVQVLSAGTTQVRVRMNVDGTLAVVTGSTASATTATAVPLNTAVIVEAAFGIDSAGTGRASVKWYTPGNSASIPAGQQASATGLTNTSDVADAVRFGSPVTPQVNLDLYLGNLAYSADSAPGGVAASTNAAPTANAGPDQSVTTGQTVTLTGTGTDTDGTIASYDWTLPTRPAGSAAVLSGTGTTRTFTADVAGTYTASLTVTDNGGTTSAADIVNVVAAAPAATGPHVRVAGAYVQSADPLARVGGVYV